MTATLGEIRMFAGNFAPVGWYACDGALYPISQNDALYSLLGTTYGGDGQTTFAVPDLRGRAPVHRGQGPGLSSYGPGDTFGAETVTVTPNQMPHHTHPVPASGGIATSSSPVGAVPATLPQGAAYATSGAEIAMTPSVVSAAGGSQPHDNLPPSLAITFIIAADGIFPSQS